MRKGQETRVAIVSAALEIAARSGLEGLTIGVLAERMQMSKSGVFAHFGSREDLQIAVLKAYGERFVGSVLKPALQEARGLPRLVRLMTGWIEQTMLESDAGCLWIACATEYDDRPGAVRDELVMSLDGWQREVARAVSASIAEGHLVDGSTAAGTTVDDLVFDLHGAILALHHDARMMRNEQARARARRAIARALSRNLEPTAAALLRVCGLDPLDAVPPPNPSALRGPSHATVHAATP